MFPMSPRWQMATFDPSQTRSLIPRAAASQAGSHRQQGSSVSALLSTLIPIFIVATVAFLAFLFFQKRFNRVYRPRTYVRALDEPERTPKQDHPAFFSWTKEYKELTDDYVFGHSSLDNYLFLRLFKMMMLFSFVGCIITWPILFPVNATGGAGESGLDILSFSNIATPARYYAHCFVAWIFLAFVMFMISRESLFYAYLRQAYLLSPQISSRISSRTVLFVDVPERYQDEQQLRRIFEDVRYVWLVPDTEDLEDLVEERDQVANKLESGEVKMVTNYVKKRNGKGDNDQHPEDGRRSDSGSSIYVDPKDRPTHRLKPLIGKKVDTIRWARSELHRLIPKVTKRQGQQRRGEVKTIGAVFIEFETVRAAQSAYQQVAHQTPFHITPKEVGMTPDQVLWKNLKKPWWLVKVIAALSTALVTFLCLFWTIPVAFIGVLTNVNYLTNELPWLSFINDIPSQILGIVTGLLPVLLLSILMKLVPILCALLARQFEPTMGAVQLKVQSWYFAFEVIQVFLITTFSSGAASVATQIVQNPVQAPQLLAMNLPKASNFYISYFILFGLSTAALQLLNVVPLLMVLVLGKFLDKTPRKMYNRYVQLSGIGWGSFYPKYTNLGVIALAYSCIAPLVLGFATVGFGLLYLAFRYNMLFTLGTDVDTKGRAYARALQQLTVGIYLSEICLIGLFAIGSSGSLSSIGPLILMVIFLVGTVIWHFQLRSAVHKHVISLPNDLLAKERQYDRDERQQEDEEKAQQPYSPEHAFNDDDRFQTTQSPPTGFVGKLKAFFMPSKFASAAVLSQSLLSPHLANPVRPYTREEREEAYLHPAVIAETPVIWLARDRYGLSNEEILDTQREVGGEEMLKVTDQEAWFDEKGKVQWDDRRMIEAPVWEDEVKY